MLAMVTKPASKKPSEAFPGCPVGLSGLMAKALIVDVVIFLDPKSSSSAFVKVSAGDSMNCGRAAENMSLL